MPRTVAEIGNRIYEQLTAEEKVHLASAMQRAAAAQDDGGDVFYCNLGNAGVAVPIDAGDTVTESDMREMCRVLERARRNEAEVDEIDWEALLENAFGRGADERFVALYADAARPASVGAVVFGQLTAEEKEHLAAAMRAASESGWADGTDEFYGSLGGAGGARHRRMLREPRRRRRPRLGPPGGADHGWGHDQDVLHPHGCSPIATDNR